MPVSVRLGRKPAVQDDRVPFLHEVVDLTALPAAPAMTNWYAAVEESPAPWRMLMNDKLGCCVQAGAYHLLQSASCYAGKPIVPTDDEVVQAYSESAGYIVGNPSTDQGTQVLGPDGFMQYWLTKGLPIAGGRNKIAAFVQVKPEHWDIALYLFGGGMFGINLPQSVVSGDTIPYGWGDPSGPVAGGHEIAGVGYFSDGSARYTPLISWGQRCLASQAFLLGTIQEACCIVDAAAINASGVNASGVNFAAIENAMKALQAG